jgi:site-specific recombinase XerD
MTALAPILEGFFTDRLIRQRHASPHTVAAYRDTFRLLLRFIQATTGVAPSQLHLEDLDAERINAFLDHLETQRRSTARTRNARLAAVHSLFRYASLHHPEHSGLIQKVLAIPIKRTDRTVISYLSEAEITAVLAAPDRSTRLGRRDHALLLLALRTGLRATELTALRCGDLQFGTGAHIRCLGKGRKERITPIDRDTATVIRAWTRERDGQPHDALFPGPKGHPLTRDALRRIVARHVTAAAETEPSLAAKKTGPHTLRHSCAMQLLQAGVDTAVIALWLGHESIRTTDIYQHADLAIKQKALARTRPPKTQRGRYRPDDNLLRFLESL